MTERKKFEVWAIDQGLDVRLLETVDYGHVYADEGTEYAWLAWLAALATPAPAQPEGLTKTDIARIWRRVTGGTQFQPHEYDLFRAIADAGFAAGAAAPAEGAAREEAQEAVGKFAIEVEKMLCAKLGVSWTAAGISIVSLIDRLAAAPKEKP